jgi:3-oxoacyl-[acyl-carrier protein] reductase
MPSELEGRVVLVTGARTGLGRYLAEHFLGGGARVVGCSRSGSDLAHPDYLDVRADVGAEEAVKELFLAVRRRHGRLDVLVNNAGAYAAGPCVLTSAATAERVMRVNFLGTFLCCREAAPLMQKGGGGSIVNLTSVAVPQAPAGSAVYGASKVAVEQLTRVLARELAGARITVNALGFGPVEGTGMAAGLSPRAAEEALRAAGLVRMLKAAEVADALGPLLRTGAGAATGQVVYLGGLRGGGEP